MSLYVLSEYLKLYITLNTIWNDKEKLEKDMSLR